MEIVQIAKSPSWTSVLTGMEVGGVVNAHLSKRGTIAPLISRQLSLSHPERVWETRKIDQEGKHYLEIKRIK